MSTKETNETCRRIRITYDIVTEESAQQGDFAETGWIDEEGVVVSPDEYDLDESDGDEVAAVVRLAKKVILQRGGVEPSSSLFHPGVWYTQIDCEPNEERYSFHLKDFSPEEEKAVWHALVLRRAGVRLTGRTGQG